MKVSKLPAPAIDRYNALADHTERVRVAASLAALKVSELRDICNGRSKATAPTVAKAQVELSEALRVEKAARGLADQAFAVLSGVKIWIERNDVEVAVAEPPKVTNGVDLSEVREKISALCAQINRLKILPVPSDDIRQRVERYVGELARKPLLVRGIGAGQNLEFEWPMSLEASVRGGYISTTANPLLLCARLMPDALAADLLREIERECQTPCPPEQRPARIAELEQQLAQLQSLETMFVWVRIEAGDTEVGFDPACAPAAILGLRLQS